MLKNLTEVFNFKNTNWLSKDSKLSNNYLSEIMTCLCCKSPIVDCSLEDAARGFSKGAFFPLNTCMKCIHNMDNKKFIMCLVCTRKKAKCPIHPTNPLISVQRQLFSLMVSVRYRCKYCSNSSKEYTPK